MEQPDDETGRDRIDDAEGRMEQAESEEDPLRQEAISQLHDILELELDKPEDELPDGSKAAKAAEEPSDSDAGPGAGSDPADRS